MSAILLPTTLERLARHTLREHADASDAAPNSGDVLTWNGATSQWEPTAAGAPGAHALVGASHTASGLTPGRFLKALTSTTFGFAAHGLTYSDVGADAAGAAAAVTCASIGAATASHAHAAADITSGTLIAPRGGTGAGPGTIDSGTMLWGDYTGSAWNRTTPSHGTPGYWKWDGGTPGGCAWVPASTLKSDLVLTAADIGAGTFAGVLYGFSGSTTFTTAGWGRQLALLNGGAIGWAQSSDNLYVAFGSTSNAWFWITSTAQDASAGALYPMQLTHAGALSLAGGLDATTGLFAGLLTLNAAGGNLRLRGTAGSDNNADLAIFRSGSLAYLTDWATAGFGLTLDMTTGAASFLGHAVSMGALTQAGTFRDGITQVTGPFSVATDIVTVGTGSQGFYVVVLGSNGSNVAFLDVVAVFSASSWSPVTISSTTLVGSPGARTYSRDTGNSNLALLISGGLSGGKVNAAIVRMG